MKNFKYYINSEEIFNYLGTLWRSDLFKESHHNPNGYIHQISKKFSQQPKIFFDMHQEKMEMVHFSSWYQAIQQRYYYTNDILHDLYYHHEFFHIITMPYNNKLTFSQWEKKMTANEFWSSLESECLIYFYMPELRNISFNGEIWIDKFLNDNYYTDLYGKYYQFEDEVAKKLKSRIAYFRDNCQFNPKTKLDHQIYDYSTSSKEWAQIWHKDNSWLSVENEMIKYLIELNENPNIAIKNHIDWLELLGQKDAFGVAFGEQARLYSEVHQRLFKSAYNPIN